MELELGSMMMNNGSTYIFRFISVHISRPFGILIGYRLGRLFFFSTFDSLRFLIGFGLFMFCFFPSGCSVFLCFSSSKTIVIPIMS